MKQVHTEHAPLPAGYYAQGVTHRGLLYVSGQLPIVPAQPPAGVASAVVPIDQQTRQALANVKAIVEAAGASLSSVIKTTVYVSDVALWPDVNSAYATFFEEHAANHRPARAVVPCKTLHFGYQIEIEAVTVLPEPSA